MDEQFERRRAAVAALARSVLDRLATDDGQPRIGRMIDNQRWWRHGQEDFVGLQPCAWAMPADVPIHGWLDTFAEMKPVREAYGADPRLGARVDTLIGVEFSRQGRTFGWLLIEHVITPMVLATGTYATTRRSSAASTPTSNAASAPNRSTWSNSWPSTASSPTSR
jgi:hypothetical protein